MLGLTVNLPVSFFLLIQFFNNFSALSFIIISPDVLSHVCVFSVFFSFTFLSPDEVYCRETKEPEVESWSMSDLPVIVLVVLLLLAILVGLGCALRRFLPCLSLSLQNNYISYTSSLLSSPLSLKHYYFHPPF